MSGEFKQSLFGCFGDFRVCIITYFLPCVSEGKIAEKVGEDCIVHTLLALVPIANLVCMIMIRQKVRQQNNLDGTTVSDVLSILCCTWCALCQEAVEVSALDDFMRRA